MRRRNVATTVIGLAGFALIARCAGRPRRAFVYREMGAMRQRYRPESKELFPAGHGYETADEVSPVDDPAAAPSRSIRDDERLILAWRAMF